MVRSFDVAQDKFVDVGGLNLHYLDWGSQDKPDILLVHGMTGNCHDWDGFVAKVREDYHILALDQPGHGDSDWYKESGYKTKDYLGALEGFVDAIGLGSFIYIGHSMGAHNGLAYTASHPDRVKKLVMVDFGPAREFPSGSWTQPPQSFDSVEEVFGWLKQGRDTTPHEVLKEKALWRTKQMPSGKYVFKHDPTVSNAWDCQDLWSEAPKVSCPTLVMRGGESASVSTEYLKRAAAALPKGHYVEIPGAGHSIMLDQLEPFTAEVSSFLNS